MSGKSGRGEVAAQIDDQLIMVQTHHDLMANQGGGGRVGHLPHLDPAGAAHPHRQELIVRKAEGWQCAQMLQLLLVAPLSPPLSGKMSPLSIAHPGA